MEKKVIEGKVAELLYQYGYRQDKDNYVDIVDFVQKKGFSVGNALLPDSEDGFLAIQPNGNTNEKIIGVNAGRPIEFKRFIIAHEFAHSVLHYKDGQVFLHRENKKGKDDEENDADYFAAALLMPFQSFKRVYEQLKVAELSDKTICLNLAVTYGVPCESVARRIEEINLLTNS